MIFTLLTLLAALALATVSGWFSIIGIMSIYAGAAFHALVMGIVLEGGKLVTTSWLYRNWDHADWKLKAPLVIFTITLMLATSIGVFGFLSKSHLEQGASTVDNGAKIERLDQQIAREKSTIDDDTKVIGQLDATINSYIGKDRADRSVSVRKSQAPQRAQLRTDIDAAQKRIDGFSDEKLKLTSEVRKLQLDVGPIRYIAELVYGADGNADKNIEAAVRMFTLIIVSTLDPLAVILLIAANHTIVRRENEKKQKKTEEDRLRESNGADKPAVEKIYSEVVEENTHSEKNTPPPESIEAPTEAGIRSERIEIPLSILQEPLELLDIDEATKAPTEDYKENNPFLSSGASDTDPETETPVSIINEILAERENSFTPTSEIAKIYSSWPKINHEKEAVAEIIVREDVNNDLQYGLGLQVQASNEENYEDEGEITSENVEGDLPDSDMVESEPPILQTEILEAPVPLPVIRSPSPTKVTGIIVTPWMAQEGSLSNIIGTTPHFVAKKVNEEEINNTTEISKGDTAEISTPSAEEIQEVSLPGSEEFEIEGTDEEIPKGDASAAESNKYPKALSWLVEFKRKQNE